MRTRRWLAVASLCFGLVAVLGFTKYMQIRAAIAFGASFPEPSETVEIETVVAGEWQARISVIGEVRASRELLLRNEMEGMVASIGFTSGAEIKAGDVLMQLDIGEERARLEVIKPEIDLARQDVKRLSGLVSRKAVSQQEADRVAAQLAAAEGQADSVREVIANKTVIAPFDGVAGLHDFEVGEFVPANTVITKLVGGLDKLWIDFSVPQKYSGISAGAQIELQMSNSEHRRSVAMVQAVESSISSESRSLRVRALFDNQGRELRPGGTVTVFVPIGETRQIVRLPNTAVRMDTFGSYVFVLSKDSESQWRASRRAVTVAAKEAYSSIVTSGLQVGEVVATTGSFKLREGLLVYAAKPQSLSDPRLPAVSKDIDNVE